MGRPLTLSEMDSAAPDSTVVEMLLVPLPPESRVSEVGLAEMEKSFAGGAGWTVSVTVVPCVAPDPVPVTGGYTFLRLPCPALTVSVEPASRRHRCRAHARRGARRRSRSRSD